MACPPVRDFSPPLHRVRMYMGAGKGRKHRRAFPSSLAPDPQDSAARGSAASPPAQCAPWSWQPERREGIGPLRATPLRHRFPVTEATEKRCPPPSIPSREGCVGEGPAPSLAEETSFLRNGGCSHTERGSMRGHF